MPGLGDYPKYMKRSPRYWLVFSVALALGLGAYALMIQVLAVPAMAALLMIGTLLLAAIALVLSQKLKRVRAQRDRARVRANATRRQIIALLQNQDIRLKQSVERQVQELQSEISELYDRESLLKVQAHHDGLTGLANRILLTDRFRFAVERAKRSSVSFALLMVDLNDFKIINDNYGHAVGDAVLITMAKRLVGAVRACDTVARLGGDEFVLIIESFEDPQELVSLGQKLIETLSNSITLDSGAIVKVGASVGMALYPDHGADMNDLLFVADHAMYECKSSGLMSLH